MKKKRLIYFCIIMFLSATTPIFGQQKASSSRRPTTQPATNASTQPTAGAATQTPAANTPAAPSTEVGNSERPERPNPGNGPEGRGGFDRPNRAMGAAFAFMPFQMRAQQESSSNGKIDIKKFVAAFMSAAKEIDANNDGIITAEELQQYQETQRNNGFGFGRGMNPGGTNPERRDGPNRGNRRNEGNAQGNDFGDNLPQGTNSFTVVRGQEREQGTRQRGPGNNPNGPGARGQGGPGGPNGGPRGAGMNGPGAMQPSGIFKVVSDTTAEDGSIDLKKLESNLNKALKEADKDTDGSLNDEEWSTFTGIPRMMIPASAVLGTLQRVVLEKTRTEDGKVDIKKFRTEFIAQIKEADANNDGSLDENEVQALMTKINEENPDLLRGPGGFPGMGGGPRGFGMGGPGGFPGMGGGPGGFGMGGPNGRPNGFGMGGPQGGDFLQNLRDEDGNLDLSKLDENLPEIVVQGIRSADANGDNILDADEQQAMRDEMRARMEQQRGNQDQGRNGRPGRGNAPNDANGNNRRRGAFDAG